MQMAAIPDAQTWMERYGAIGFVAFLSLSALVFTVRNYLRDRESQKLRDERDRQALQGAVDESRRLADTLHAKIIEIVQKTHTETLDLLEEQRTEHETRYQQLLERHVASADKARQEILELANAVTTAIKSLARKLNVTEVRDGRE